MLCKHRFPPEIFLLEETGDNTGFNNTRWPFQGFWSGLFHFLKFAAVPHFCGAAAKNFLKEKSRQRLFVKILGGKRVLF